jgi:hypothetical protein
MRRILVCCAVLLTALAQPAFAATAQGWESLRALSPGKSINVHTGATHRKCSFISADDTQLTCRHGKKDTYTFARADIQKVRLGYRPTFTLIGLVAGTAAGAGIRYAVNRPNSNCVNQPTQPGFINPCGIDDLFSGIGEAVGAAAGGLIGAIAGTGGGLALDLGLRKTVFQAP